MNIRTFTIAMLISAMPVAVMADGKEISFAKEDFISGTQVTNDGETIVSAKLSKSGKAKLKKLSKLSSAHEAPLEIRGLSSDLQRRARLLGEEIEIGSFPKKGR